MEICPLSCVGRTNIVKMPILHKLSTDSMQTYWFINPPGASKVWSEPGPQNGLGVTEERGRRVGVGRLQFKQPKGNFYLRPTLDKSKTSGFLYLPAES